jgi:hypothetical protein
MQCILVHAVCVQCGDFFSSVSTLLRILTANCVAGGQAKKAREKMKREGVIDDEEVSTASGVQKKHDIFSKLSNREIEFYQEVFEKIDVDGSGEIDDQEVLPPHPSYLRLSHAYALAYESSIASNSRRFARILSHSAHLLSLFDSSLRIILKSHVQLQQTLARRRRRQSVLNFSYSSSLKPHTVVAR